MLKKSISKLSVLALIALTFTSCSKDKDSEQPSEGSYIMTMAYAPPSGFDYSYYSVPVTDLMTGTLDARGKGLEQVGYFDYTKIGNTLYSIGGLNDVKVTAIQKGSDGNLTEAQSATFPKAISDITEADEAHLLAVSMDQNTNVITFYIMDKNTVTVKNTITDSVSNILHANNPDLGLSYTGLAVVGNQVFLSYYVMDKNTFATPDANHAEVAVYSYPNLKFEKVISDNRVGSIGGFNIKNGLIKTENGDVYAISSTNPANGFNQDNNYPQGILRIKKGTTEFDSGYYFNTNAVHVLNLGGNKVFAELNKTPKNDQTPWSDGTLTSAILDLGSQTVTVVSDVPTHQGNGRRLAALQEGDFVYLPVTEDNGIFIYKINTNNGTAVKGAQVASSFVAGVFHN